VSKQLLISLITGLAVVAIAIGILLIGTKGNHLELTGTILKVRVMPLSPVASLVIVDFRVFKYNPILGPKFNDVLAIKDRIEPHQRLDRMVGARFEITDEQAEDRKAIHLHIEEIDGVTADLVEKK